MGLDMYVYRLNKEGEVADLMKGKWWDDEDGFEELMYWRKFYELDGWFTHRGERIELISEEPYAWKWYVYKISKALLEELKADLEAAIDCGVYVYRDGQPPRERVNLTHENYRQQLEDADVNWERDEILPVYESKLGDLAADCGYTDWYWLHLWNTYDELVEKLPTIKDDDVLVYYPSF